jgi:formylglycine-generating enzyme required for sulfatase activity
MKSSSYLALAAVLSMAGGTLSAFAAPSPVSFVYETEREFVGTGDFDADGRLDLFIVDRDTGRVRVGYQAGGGIYLWATYVNTGIKDLSGVSVGKLFAANKDSVAAVSADGNGVAVVELAKPGQAGTAVTIVPPGLGPNSVVAIDVGGAGNTPLMDLFINTTYNTPTPNQATLLRNDAGKFVKLGTVDMPGAVQRGNRVSLADGQPELVGAIISGDAGDSFRVDSFASGKGQTVGAIKEIPAGSDYLVGSFRGAGTRDVLFFKAGENQFRAYTAAVDGTAVKFGEARSFDLGKPIKYLVGVPADGGDRLVAIFTEGTNATLAGVFTFDGAKAPVQVQSFKANEGEVLSGAGSFPNGFALLSSPALGKIRYSTRYQIYALGAAGGVPGARGSLPSLDDMDDSTVPGIHKFIVAQLKEKTEAEMKPYTNTIPGTTVKYSMVPIPGGEFVMGSPADEKGRKEDEGPQHKVKIEPFWMEQFEVGWNEYELFMYRDEERKFKDTIATDPEVDKVSDAVTRPSKPYVEMSFGMGKDGFPAIAMTHHAANKYCHWLSAKTGHFYRLPTEAEWEYACRAGSTTTWFFGNEESKLQDYAWYEMNSDFKYQKSGKKKPNPWGLYDTHGNVTEWCLDQYDPGFYSKAGSEVVLEPWNKASKPYPHAVRGGSWDEVAAACRSAARRGSDRAWKQQDPQLPKSVWWLSDAQWVGFRIIRPLKVPPPAEMVKCWITGTEKD